MKLHLRHSFRGDKGCSKVLRLSDSLNLNLTLILKTPWILPKGLIGYTDRVLNRWTVKLFSSINKLHFYYFNSPLTIYASCLIIIKTSVGLAVETIAGETETMRRQRLLVSITCKGGTEHHPRLCHNKYKLTKDKLDALSTGKRTATGWPCLCSGLVGWKETPL